MKVPEKRVLFLSFWFPPDYGVGCLRNFKIARLFARSGEVTVVTSARAHYSDHKRKFRDPDLEIEYISNLDLKSLLPLGFRQMIKRTLKKRKSLDSPLLHGGPGYIHRAVDRASKIIESKKINHIFCGFQPLVDLEIASRLKSSYPELHWICDIRDYPDLVSNSPGKVTRKLVSLLGAADSLTSSTQGLGRYLEGISGRDFVPLYSSRNPYARNEMDDIRPLIVKDKNKIIISYAGSLYGDRCTDMFFDDLSKFRMQNPDIFDRIELRYLGMDADSWSQWIQRYDLEDRSVSMGFLSATESLEEIHRSDILVYLDYDAPGIDGVVGYKFWDYLLTDAPVLLYSRNAESEMARFDRETLGIFTTCAAAISSCDLGFPARKDLLDEHDREMERYFVEVG